MRLNGRFVVQGMNASTRIGRLFFARRGRIGILLGDCHGRLRAVPLVFVFEPERPYEEKARSVAMPIAFLRFSIHREPMGQQLRVRIKRKRRVAYLRRKNAARRTAATRSTPIKQTAQKESAASE